MGQIISPKGKCTKAGECSRPALGIQCNQVLKEEVPLQNGTWLGQLIFVRRQPAFTTLLSLAEEASGQLPGSISWKKFTMGQTINERKVGQRDPAMGPSFKEKGLGKPHKVLEDNHEAVSRCFRDHLEEVRPRVGCT